MYVQLELQENIKFHDSTGQTCIYADSVESQHSLWQDGPQRVSAHWETPQLVHALNMALGPGQKVSDNPFERESWLTSSKEQVTLHNINGPQPHMLSVAVWKERLHPSLADDLALAVS